MGQYHYVVNLDRKEYVDPHKIGCGLKLWEQLANHPGTGAALLILLAASNGRGGGDLDDADIIGSWAGDRIAVVGDYAENGDLPPDCKASKIYEECKAGGSYTDVTDAVCKVIEKELDGKFTGTGWKTFEKNGGTQ